MAKPLETLWDIDLHTLAKHEILRRYLGAWFPILATHNGRILYLDGFCGPGRYKGGEDGSPIVALKEAMKHNTRFTNRDVTFLFIDSEECRVEHLKSELALLPIPANFSVLPIHDQFDNAINGIFEELAKQGARLAPTFAFIDPFGFKGVSFDSIKKLLKNPKTEVFINVMVEFINRFLEHPNPVIQQQIIDLFGTPKVIDVINSGGDRVTELRLLYQNQLLAHARFVRYFEMRDEHNRVIYYLFFATNHPLGHVRMKEAFWRVDPSSGFSFCDRTNPGQMVLFNLDPSQNLGREILLRFKGNKLLVAEIRQCIEDETPFIASQMRSALKYLEMNEQICVSPCKADGKKRLKRTFPDNAIIEFVHPS